MARAPVNEDVPQKDIDLMFWQYMSGIVDAVNQEGVFLIPADEMTIMALRDRKLASIKDVYGKPPTFNLSIGLAYKDGEYHLTLDKINI